MTTPAIEVRGLRKSYGEKVVLDGIDLTVGRGHRHRPARPERRRQDDDRAHPVARCCARTAARPGRRMRRRARPGRRARRDRPDRPVLGGRQAAHRRGEPPADGPAAPPRREAPKARVAELLERFDLVEAARKPLATYSGGMQRRLDLAMTLVATPSVIFLDEPTTGLDPRSRHTMWDIVRGLVADGTTVLLTTQYLDEADELADRIAVLDGGRIVAEGTPDELKRLVPGGHIRLRFADAAALDAASRLLEASARDDAALVLSVPSDGGVAPARLLDRLDAADVEVDDLSIHTPDLDDVFFALTGSRTAVRRTKGTES